MSVSLLPARRASPRDERRQLAARRAEVGKLLGHVSPITTQRYAHLADLDASDVLAALGPGPTSAARKPAAVDELAARRARRAATGS